MKVWFCTLAGFIGTAFTLFFGGLDKLLAILCLMIALDYLTGSMVAAVFKASPKTEHGCANSTVGFKGIVKKVYILVLVGVANALDMVLGSDFCRPGVIIAFITNETLSILENAGLMGVPIPKFLKDAIEVLNKKE